MPRGGKGSRDRDRREWLTACAGCTEVKPSRQLTGSKELLGRYCASCHETLVRIFVPLEARGHDLGRYFTRTYGITFADYAQMYLRQRGRCAICEVVPEDKQLVVDHCHDTGRVRGLLCGACNTGIGMFRDSTRSLARAIVYLCP